MILDIFDVEGAATLATAHQCLNDAAGQRLDEAANTRRRRTLASRHRQEGLGHRDRNLLRFECNHRAIAPDDPVVLETDRMAFGVNRRHAAAATHPLTGN